MEKGQSKIICVNHVSISIDFEVRTERIFIYLLICHVGVVSSYLSATNAVYIVIMAIIDG